MLWIQYENNVGNTLILWLLLSSAYPKSGNFQFPTLWQRAGAQEAGREHSQDSRPELAKGIFHAMEHHGQCTHWGGWSGAADCLSGMGWALVRA